MKKGNRFYFMLFITLLIFASCTIEDSSDVNQEKIYADYEVFYNSNTDKTLAIAKFKFGGATGTVLQLSDPAQVTFNGDKLAFKPIYAGHIKEYAGRITQGTFVYENTLGNSYSNAIPMVNTIDFPSDLDTLSKSNAYTFIWNGLPLEADESVGLFVGSWTWGQDALFFQNSPGDTEIVMGTNKLGNLPLGSSTMYMDRSKQNQISEGTEEGGFIRAKYRAENIEITVIE